MLGCSTHWWIRISFITVLSALLLRAISRIFSASSSLLFRLNNNLTLRKKQNKTTPSLFGSFNQQVIFSLYGTNKCKSNFQSFPLLWTSKQMKRSRYSILQLFLWYLLSISSFAESLQDDPLSETGRMEMIFFHFGLFASNQIFSLHTNFTSFATNWTWKLTRF